jgi:membrane protease subunit HflK
VFSNTTKVMIDTRSGNNLLYLPFDKLMQQAIAETNQQPRATVTPPAAAEPTTPAEARTRDAVRSRDRENR